MTTCIGIIPDCPDCLAEPEARPGHECDDLCELFGEMKQNPETHRIVHEPRRCDHCKAVIDDRRNNDRTVTRPCANGTCRIWACPDCDAEVAGDGPIGCPVCSPVEGEFAKHVAVAEARLADWRAREETA